MFSETGEVSEMRVMSLISLFVGSFIAIYGMTKTPVDYSGVAMLAGLFIGAAFTGKIAQKRVEVDGQKSATTEQKNS